MAPSAAATQQLWLDPLISSLRRLQKVAFLTSIALWQPAGDVLGMSQCPQLWHAGVVSAGLEVSREAVRGRHPHLPSEQAQGPPVCPLPLPQALSSCVSGLPGKWRQKQRPALPEPAWKEA